MSFEVAAEAYTRFMGRFSEPLAIQFAELVSLRAGQRVLDVGCGPGALTAELVHRLGPTRVVAIDPSASFVAAARERFPGVDVREGCAEQLPFPDASFDVVLAQLVVHFMTDPMAGLAEMGRVSRPGGAVGACVWDHAGDAGPLSVFWRAVHDLDPDAKGEAGLAGVGQGQLLALSRAAGLRDSEESRLTVPLTFTSFDDWWDPFTLRVGPAGAYVGGLGPDAVAALRERCEQLLPPAPFEVTASAWCVVARR